MIARHFRRDNNLKKRSFDSRPNLPPTIRCHAPPEIPRASLELGRQTLISILGTHPILVVLLLVPLVPGPDFSAMSESLQPLLQPTVESQYPNQQQDPAPAAPPSEASGSSTSTTTPSISELLRSKLENENSRRRPAPRGTAAYPRKRANRACQVCRARRTKCDNKKPSCSFCEKVGAKCITSPTDLSSYASLSIFCRK